MFTSQSIIHLAKPDGAMIVNLPLFPLGVRTALNYIPDNTAGIYAWFRTFKYSDDPEMLFAQIIADIERPKFVERTGVIAPYYQVGVSSYGKLSDGKRQRLIEAMKCSRFREDLKQVLGNSIMFQAPLYVGKASNLRIRIEQHLSSESILRLRLDAVGIDIEKSLLMICPLGDSGWDTVTHENTWDMLRETESHDDDDDELEQPRLEKYEDLYEEIFSRLFSPQFTVKIG